MKRQFIQIGFLLVAFLSFSLVAFSYYHSVKTTVVNEAEVCTKEPQKNTEMLWEKLARQFVGAVSLD